MDEKLKIAMNALFEIQRSDPEPRFGGWTEAYGIAKRTLEALGVVDPHEYGSVGEYIRRGRNNG